MADKNKLNDLAGKGKGFANEFREFVMRGSVMDLAVGVIIGGAFQSIINSLVNDIIMPVISMLTGGIDFTNWFISLDGNKYETYAAAQEAGAATLGYGAFITAIINFLLMALVIFCLVKFLNSVAARVKKEEAAEPTEKECPYCKAMIPIGAVKCQHCTSDLPEK
ncbi:MAG: large conductance mechanosensitive channel protein MscL [Lachnospiraceae bacterium]|nr:large conductance mechanosensitive channel protein MscL [Lachnospiraceae bacterium]